MYSVYQHWDPLNTCVVGSCYPPEFFSFIDDPVTRTRFERLSQESQDDMDGLARLLQDRFGVTVLRPCMPDDWRDLYQHGRWIPPPVTPRDYFIMIGEKLWIPITPNRVHAWRSFCRQQGQSDWQVWDYASRFFEHDDVSPDLQHQYQEFCSMDQQILFSKLQFYNGIFEHVADQHNPVVRIDRDHVSGCFVSRIGQDLFFATQSDHDQDDEILRDMSALFPVTRNHVVRAAGHGDAVYCPVCPGLIISLMRPDTYQHTFPGWEVVQLPPSDYAQTRQFRHTMKVNGGRWWIPGFEKDPHLVQIVDHYFDDWVGQASETVFDVNILIVDPKNIIVSSENRLVEKACQRYGIEMHVCPQRHRYFWDAGIHCLTNDLDRQGTQQDFFRNFAHA